MKKMLLKFSDSLLSREQTKGIKGGNYPPSGGGGQGCNQFVYIRCQSYAGYYENWIGWAGCCPTPEFGQQICSMNNGSYLGCG